MISGLYSLLSTAAALEALVGTRVYPLLLPDTPTLPAITLQVVGSQVVNAAFSARGIMKYRIQADCWGATYASASAVRDALVTVLDGFVGPLSDGTTVQSAQLLQHLDIFEEDALQYRLSSEYYLWAAL
jgi:hypothetical protein